MLKVVAVKKGRNAARVTFPSPPQQPPDVLGLKTLIDS
jgi:hypothetical protein